jgi:hypothetical protein
MAFRQLRWLFVSLFAVVVAVVSAQQPAGGGLRIVVIDGEDGVNIIQTKTAVQSIVEVRDRNNLPVAGALVTFLLPGGNTAAFANNARMLTMATDSAGRATTQGLQAIGKGSFKIQVNVSYQGQTATTSITQTNFTSVAEAAQAGKTPGSQSGSQASNAGSSASSAGSTAGAAGAAGGAGAAGATAATTGAVGAAGGGGAGLSGVVVGGIVAGGAVGGVVVARRVIGSSSDDSVPGAQCTAQENALQNQANSLSSTLTSYQACFNGATSPGAIQACQNQFNNAFSAYFVAAGDWCTCLGVDAGQTLTAEEKASVRDAFNTLQAAGINVGTLPACYR